MEQLDQEIDTAERTIRKTDSDIAVIRQQIEDGENVAPDVIPKRAQLRSHLQAVVSGLRSRRARAAAAARLDRLQELRTEIENYIREEDGGQLERLMQIATDAQVAVLASAQRRRDEFNSWSRRLTQEEVPNYSGHLPEPHPAHVGLGKTPDAMAVGTLRIQNTPSGDALLNTMKNDAQRLLSTGGTAKLHRFLTEAQGLEVVAPEHHRYYIGEGGMVLHHAPDREPRAFSSVRPLVREITRQEAIDAWERAGTSGQKVTSAQQQAVTDRKGAKA